MKRVVITGMGIVSPIGNSKREVLKSLRESISGISFIPEMKEMGLQCQVAGRVKSLDTTHISKRPLQTMSDVARFAAVAVSEALEDARLPKDTLKSPRIGIVMGTAFGGISEALKVEAHLLARKNPTGLGAKGAVKIMNSSAALNLAAWLGAKGRCYSVSSACATGTNNIGHGFELIRHGSLDVCLCGGAEEFCAMIAAFLDNLAVTPSDFNDRPEKACRPYDRDRQGMVVSEGAGVLILEALEHATSRGVRAYSEVISYGSSNDAAEVFEPTGRGLKYAIGQALDLAKALGPLQIDYINPHGAGTRTGDAVEVQVIREIFGTPSPLVSSTKSLSGHAQGAAGAHEAIFTLLMLHHGLIAPTVNLEHIAPDCRGVSHVQTLMEVPFRTAMTFNSGLGGTNACIIFRKL